MSERVPSGSLSQRVAEEVRVALARQNKSQRTLADDLGVSPPWLNYRLTGVQEIGLNDLERIAGGLGLRVCDLMPVDLTSEVGAA